MYTWLDSPFIKTSKDNIFFLVYIYLYIGHSEAEIESSNLGPFHNAVTKLYATETL